MYVLSSFTHWNREGYSCNLKQPEARQANTTRDLSRR
jgi:hypothetical protein